MVYEETLDGKRGSQRGGRSSQRGARLGRRVNEVRGPRGRSHASSGIGARARELLAGVRIGRYLDGSDAE